MSVKYTFNAETMSITISTIELIPDGKGANIETISEFKTLNVSSDEMLVTANKDLVKYALNSALYPEIDNANAKLIKYVTTPIHQISAKETASGEKEYTLDTKLHPYPLIALAEIFGDNGKLINEILRHYYFECYKFDTNSKYAPLTLSANAETMFDELCVAAFGDKDEIGVSSGTKRTTFLNCALAKICTDYKVNNHHSNYLTYTVIKTSLKATSGVDPTSTNNYAMHTIIALDSAINGRMLEVGKPKTATRTRKVK